MKKLLSLLIVASAVAPLHARSDFELEMREHQREIREKKAETKKVLESKALEGATCYDCSPESWQPPTRQGGEAGKVDANFRKVWKGILIAIGEDSNDDGNYPNLLLACGVLFTDPIASCGSDEAKKALEKETIKHHVLALKTENVLRELHYKKDPARLQTISDGIASLDGHQKRITEALAADGKKYRYAYDQTSLSGESFQKDVKYTWETAREIAGILETESSQGSGR